MLIFGQIKTTTIYISPLAADKKVQKLQEMGE
jgi:hypothetical protein